MWCSKRKNGKGTRYVYRERFTDKKTGKQIILSVTMNTNSRHAQKMAVSLLQEKYNDKMMTAKDRANELAERLTLEDVCKEWLEDSALTVKSETMDNHKLYCRRILKGLPQNILLRDFTPVKAEHIVKNMYYKENLSFTYSSSVLNTIKTIMRYAKKAGYIDKVYEYEQIKLKRRPISPEELEKRRNKFLNQQELQECLKQLQVINPRLAMAMEFISLTGLRCGEMLALKWENVNLEKKFLQVKWTLVKIFPNGDDLQLGTPKNIYSNRTVYLNDRAVSILQWFKIENQKMMWKRQGNSLCPNYVDRGFIFTTRNGTPYNIQFINHRLRKIKIPGKRITTHIFRHTHISMLASMNAPLKAIMARVGHNDPTTTLAVYTHVTDKMKKEMHNKLDKMNVWA